jgi:cold shock CspA family protein
MKSGIISSFNRERGMGTILVEAAICERYFFYDNKIVDGRQPTVGAKVLFHVSNKEPQPGQLRYAEGITVLPYQTKAEVFTISVLKAGGAE